MDGLLWLHDPRLKRLALSQSPAWVWAQDAKRVLWTNPIAAALFDAPTPAAFATRIFDGASTAANEVARLAATLRPDRGPRLERLRGFGATLAGRSTYSCSCIRLADGTTAVLIIGFDRSEIHLSLEQRAARLLAACTEPIAVFADDGALLGATPSARRRLNGITTLDATLGATLDALGVDTLMATARTGGSAVGACASGPISIERLREPAAWIVTLDEPERLSGPDGTRSAADESAAKAPADGPSHISAPRLSAAEQRTFQELSRQLAKRISEADALAARAANTHAPIDARAHPDRPDRPEASSSKRTDRPFLDALPVGVLVYRDDQLLYANPAFKRWSGCGSLDALATSGGLDGLTIAPGVSIAEQSDRQPFTVASASTERLPADARRLHVPWDGEWVSALLIMPAGDETTRRASAKP